MMRKTAPVKETTKRGEKTSRQTVVKKEASLVEAISSAEKALK